MVRRLREYADPKLSDERGRHFLCRHTRDGLTLMNTMKKQSQKPSPGQGSSSWMVRLREQTALESNLSWRSLAKADGKYGETDAKTTASSTSA